MKNPEDPEAAEPRLSWDKDMSFVTSESDAKEAEMPPMPEDADESHGATVDSVIVNV